MDTPVPQVQQETNHTISQESAQTPLNNSNFSLKRILIVTAVVLFMLVLAGGYLLGARNGQTTKKATQTQLVPNPNNTVDEKHILNSLERALNVTATISVRNNIDWFNQNKQKLPLMGQNFGLGTFANAYLGKYGNYAQYPSPNYLKDVTMDSLKPLQTGVEEFFISNGFQKDIQNTFSNSYISLGYRRSDIKCLITLIPNGDPLGNFFCGTVDDTQIAWRKELTSAINPTNDPNVEFSVDKLLGNYAAGSGFDSHWYAVKINGQWQKVWSGQNIISCKPVDQYNIPKEIYGNDCSTNY